MKETTCEDTKWTEWPKGHFQNTMKTFEFHKRRRFTEYWHKHLVLNNAQNIKHSIQCDKYFYYCTPFSRQNFKCCVHLPGRYRCETFCRLQHTGFSFEAYCSRNCNTHFPLHQSLHGVFVSLPLCNKFHISADRY